MTNSCVDTSVSSLFWCVSWTAINPLAYVGICLLRLLHTFSTWFTSPHLKHFFPYARHHPGSGEFSQSLQFMGVSLLHDLALSGLNFYVFSWYWTFLLSSTASISAFCALYSSILLVQLNTCLLVISWVFITMVTSHKSSYTMSSSFMPLVNCSFSLLSLYLYSHSFSFLENFHFVFLISLQYCKDKTASLCWCLHFSPSTLNSPTLVLHVSCCLSFNVSTNCSPSLPSQLSIIGIF